MMAKPADPSGKHSAAQSAARSGGEPERPRDMPKAGWFAILKRSVREFKHDDITGCRQPASVR